MNLNEAKAIWFTGVARQPRLPPHRCGQYPVCAARIAGDVARRRLENSWARHARNHQALKAGIEAMGLRFVVDEAYRFATTELGHFARRYR